MAKRKRLSPAQNDYLVSETPALETKSALGPDMSRAPIAQVAGEAATSAALAELAGEMRQAREEGRLILTLDADAIEAGYLVRDRLVADDEELQALMESLRARGQQTPVEVVALEGGRYGLISGWRRLTALRRLMDETGEARFGQVRAVLRRPDTAAEAYVAMVEENEIRVGLSYYERARVAAKAVEQGVFETESAALLALYAAASRPKRSKIRSFLALYHAADDVLRFPSAIGERLGLALAKALDEDGAPARLRQVLTQAGAGDAEAEQAVLQDFAAGSRAAVRRRAAGPDPVRGAAPGARAGTGATTGAETAMAGGSEDIVPGIRATWTANGMMLSGPGLTEPFRQAMFDWIRKAR